MTKDKLIKPSLTLDQAEALIQLCKRQASVTGSDGMRLIVGAEDAIIEAMPDEKK